ncbi:hypothetical protein Misp06_02572 [Microbulbifer sp. NBRC 101763]|uniref:RNA polymerase sigma factor n=1 Tax=Microbulbifer epialgicus TaxID=393907 RepID=A0ABV4P3G1_9GAMM|nr:MULTISPECIES: sigma-70 family RNA polymerase sigma factor [Microbulbifer]WHI52403.1 sigma-70 family RNA polymerase sigma factor [Microbulbifer sp. MLAF003]
MSRKAFQHLTDEALLDHYKETRKTVVFHQLYTRHKDALYRYSIQMAPASSAKILQELWQKILENPPQLHGRLFRNWLFIQINKALREQQALNEHKSTAVDYRKSAVLVAIQKLPSLQRNILLLHMECKLSLATVADIEQISLKKCREYYHRAKEQIETLVYGVQPKPWQVEVIEE